MVVRMVDTLPDAELMGIVGTLLPQVLENVGIREVEVEVDAGEDAALSVEVAGSEVTALVVAVDVDVDSTLVWKVVGVTGTEVLWKGGSVLKVDVEGRLD